MKKTGLILSVILFSLTAQTQDFFYGADLSYVNELEDCGVVYKEDNSPKDPYTIFADHGCNLIRLRLWHTPSWYDNLNAGNRYSDLADVKKSIQRAKNGGMNVLLDFHLSDNWADPGKQIVPAAWSAVVDDLDILKDSLYHYIYQTLEELHQDNLLPELIQIGNETNRGILLSQAENDSGWVLDWNRNSTLFNEAIKAVRDFETAKNQSFQLAIHIANPAQVDWYIENFVANGVTDFEIIGISYYDEWHVDSNIEEVGNIVAALRQDYNKEVMIFEAGYPWTSGSTDNASNILNSQNPDYAPFSPDNQKKWLVDLAKAVQNNGGKGLVYWEPAWVTSACNTQWGQGSHYENATFFSFQNNLQSNGGIKWMTEALVSIPEIIRPLEVKLLLQENHRSLEIRLVEPLLDSLSLQLYSSEGKVVISKNFEIGQTNLKINLPDLAPGIYLANISNTQKVRWTEQIAILQR